MNSYLHVMIEAVPWVGLVSATMRTQQGVFSKSMCFWMYFIFAGDVQSKSPSPDVSPMSECWVRQLASPPTAAAFGDGVVYVNTQGVTGEGGRLHAIDVFSGRDLWVFDGKDNSVGKFIILVYCNMKHLYSRPARIVQLDS